MARSSLIGGLAMYLTTMPFEIELSRRIVTAACAPESRQVIRRYVRMKSFEALFRLPYMSLQFPGFVVWLCGTRCALKGHGCKTTPVYLEDEWVSNK
jgi:hypothetical protein